MVSILIEATCGDERNMLCLSLRLPDEVTNSISVKNDAIF
jgi:hypothetical protein